MKNRVAHKNRKAAAPESDEPGGRRPAMPSSYLSFCTRPGEGSSVPQFPASGAPAAVAPGLPVGLLGINVNEPMHRFDAAVQDPSLEAGIRSANRIGETLAQLSMRWTLAPDGFVATPASEPPPTGFINGASQRFVMQGGVITFLDRPSSALRFFGAGRTYSATTDGQARLMLAGTATIIEGLGALKGVRGTLLISGEITSSAAVSLTIVGRYDSDGPVQLQDTLGPLREASGPDLAATEFIMLGDSADGQPERLRGVQVGNDLGADNCLRSLVCLGGAIGSASGQLPFGSATVQRAVSLTGARRVLMFTDGAGKRIGSVEAADLEGTTSAETLDGETISRLSGYGLATNGTGALAGACGVLVFDAAIDSQGGATISYLLRLADPAGRFRAAGDAPRLEGAPNVEYLPPGPVPLESLTFTDGRAGLMSATDKEILRLVEPTLAAGAQLLHWWKQKDGADDYPERFDVVREYSQGDRTFGFFDRAVVSDSELRVMGVVQEMFYDRQKAASPAMVSDQVREFILRYFMRVSQFRAPEAVAPSGSPAHAGIESAMSWLPEPAEHRVGFGYEQAYYKLKDSGRIGKFPAADREAIVDLREVGPVYDWIVLKVDIFDFYLSFSPFGSEALRMQLPLKESTYLVLGPPFVTHRENPAPDVLAEYGFGYAFIPYAPPDAPPMIAYGPGYFAAAIKSVTFRVMRDGEVRVRAAFIVNRPDQIASVDIDPVDWGMQVANRLTFGAASRVMAPVKAMADRLPLRINGVDPIAVYIRLANALTGGVAEHRYGISKVTLEKKMLLQHFMQHHEMFMASLLAWHRVADWTDRHGLPDYCREGVTS